MNNYIIYFFQKLHYTSFVVQSWVRVCFKMVFLTGLDAPLMQIGLFYWSGNCSAFSHRLLFPVFCWIHQADKCMQ